MSKVVQWKRGNVTVNDTYTGANGEVTIDTTNWNLRVHDGITAGGYTIDSNQGGSSFSNLTVTGFANIGNVVITDNQIYANTGNIKLQSSNTSVDGIFIRGDNGRIGFNTEPWEDGIGFDATFGNSSLYSREYWASGDYANGYQFLTPGGRTGFSHAYDLSQGNVSLIQVKHDDIAVIKFQDNNTSELRGNLVVSSDGATFGSFPNAFVQMYGNVDSYQQLVQQNLSDGTSASTDIVATADNGDDSTYYIDMGIDGSNYSDPAFFGDVATKNDGYLYVVGYDATGPSTGNVGNLILGSTNGLVKTFVGNIAQANVVTTVSQGLLTVAGNVAASNFVGTVFADYVQFLDGGSETESYISETGFIVGSNNTSTIATLQAQDVRIITDFNGGSTTWTFGATGTLTLPGNLVTSNTYVPSASNSAGTAGQITWDGDYVYVCVATDTWKRANLSTW